MLKFHDGKKMLSQSQLQKVVGEPMQYMHKGKSTTMVITAINRRGDNKIEIQGYNERSGMTRTLTVLLNDGKLVAQ